MGKKSNCSDEFDYWEYADTPSLYPRKGQGLRDTLIEAGIKGSAKVLEIVIKDIWTAHKQAREEEKKKIQRAEEILLENKTAETNLQKQIVEGQTQIELKKLEIELQKQQGENRVNELKQLGENEVNRLWAEAKSQVFKEQNTPQRPRQAAYATPDSSMYDLSDEPDEFDEPWLQLLGEVDPSEDVTPDNIREALAREPRSRQLFGEYLYERDKAYWGARAGVGKTTLAFQCATDLARGRCSEAFGNANTPIPQLVYFLDFETGASDMLGKQRELLQQCPRGSIVYKDYVGQFETGDIGYIGVLLAIMARLIWENRRDMTFFIDNITALCGDNVNCNKVLRNGIDKLEKNGLQRFGVNVTFVCLAHITEGDDYMLLKRENVRGNKAQITWATSVLLFGKTHTGGRYIKQLKNRKGDNPDEDLVVTTRLEGQKEGKSHWVAEDIDYECNVIVQKPKSNKSEAVEPKAPQSDSALAEMGEDDESKSWSREKIEFTEEMLVRCREVYDEAIRSGKGKTAALREAAGEVLGDAGKYKTIERRLGL